MAMKEDVFGVKEGDPFQMEVKNNYKRPTPSYLILAYPIVTFLSCVYLQNFVLFDICSTFTHSLTDGQHISICGHAE